MDTSTTNETDSNFTNISNNISVTASETSITTSPNSNLLNLPFHITNDLKIIRKTKYYYDNLTSIIWGKNMTFEDYLNEILSFKNKYFNIQNQAEIALNQLNLKQIMDLRMKTKEYIRNIEYFNHNENQILADLSKMATIHSNQITTFNKKFNETENIYHTHAEKYHTYIIMIYKQHKSLKNTTLFIRYAMKLEIDFDVELHRREGLVFDWKCNTYDNINMYFKKN